MAQDKSFGDTLYFSQWGGERPIPDVFVAAMERAEERTAGFVPDAEIPADVKADPNVVDAYFDTRERRTNEKVLVVVRKKAGNITLSDIRTTDQGQTVQVESTLFYTTDSTFSRSYPSATQDVSIKDLGNGWSIQEVAVSGTWTTDDPPVFVPGLYQGIELVTRKDDPLPNWLTSGVEEEQVQEVVGGVVAQPTLAADDLSASERQIGEGKKLVSRLTRDAVALPTNQRYSKQLEDILPVRFRGLVPTTSQRYAEQGTVANPTLGTGELVRSEEQVSALVKMVEVLSRTGVSFPVVVTDTATITEYGGGLVVITSSINVAGTYAPDEGEGVVSSKVTKLGEGHELKETVARYAGAWPTRTFARWSARFQTLISGTRQVVAKLSTTPGLSGSTLTEVEPVDGYREDKVVSTLPYSVIDAYSKVLHCNTNINLPAELVSVTSHPEGAAGNGTYNENGIYSLGGSGGSGGLTLQGSAQASAAIIFDASWNIKEPTGQGVPCLQVLFFVSPGTARATILTRIATIVGGGITINEWPKWSPRGVSIKCSGQKKNLSLRAQVSAHDAIVQDYLGTVKTTGSSRTQGGGANYDVAQNIKIIRIPATVHASLSLGGTVSDEAAASASFVLSLTSGASITQGAVGIVAGGTAALLNGSATAGTATIPTTGWYLHHLNSEPDPEFDRLKVFAEIVSFTEIV